MQGTGFNSEEIKNLCSKVDDIASKSVIGIKGILEKQIIEPMGDAWYAPEAVEYFTAFHDVVSNTAVDIQAAFQGYVDNLILTGKCWAENTGAEAIASYTIDDISLDISISNIKNDSNGNIMIIEDAATAVENKLADVQTNIETELENNAKELSASAALLGHEQDVAVEQCFVRVSKAIKVVFSYLTEGETSLKTAINGAVAKYKEIATQIHDSYNDLTINSSSSGSSM